MNKIKKIFYIAEIHLPSSRAYTIHVLKMIDNLSYFAKKIELLILNSNSNLQFSTLKKKFLLSSKKKILINSVNKKVNNTFNRILFGITSALYLKKQDGLIITRSLYASFFLTIIKKKHFLEIHNELFGFTKFIFIYCRFIESKFIINVIFISNNLAKIFKNYKINALILPDGVEIKNFNKKSKINKNIKNIIYVGSFYQGRGIDLILKIAKKLKKYNFFLYGKRNDNEINNLFISNNVKIYNFIDYNKIPSILKSADLLLMPYSKKNVSINSKKNNTVKFMSPLKMFEYLASGVPTLSSNILVLKEILINKYNSIIVKNNTPKAWINEIKRIDNSYQLRSYISANQIKTAKKNSWFLRSKKIVNQYLIRTNNNL